MNYSNNTLHVVILASILTGCVPTYAWKNYNPGMHNDAQLSRDRGECQMVAYQSVPAVVPQQNITQNTYIQTQPQTVGGMFAQFGNNSGLITPEMAAHNRQQKALNEARNNIFNGCMSARGWKLTRVE